MPECPECGRRLLSGVCVSCGWHSRGNTILHRDFVAEPDRYWCEVSRDA